MKSLSYRRFALCLPLSALVATVLGFGGPDLALSQPVPPSGIDEPADAMPIDPAVAEIYNAGLEAANLADFATAKAKFEEAVSIAPAWKDAQYNLGLVYQNLGDFSGAEKAFKTTLELDPDNSSAKRLLADALLGQDKFSEAIPAYTAAIAVDSTRTQLYYSRAEASSKAYLDPNDYPKVIADFEAALAQDGTHPGAYSAAISIGSLNNKLGNPDGAIAGYQRASNIRPDSATPYYNCGVIFRKQKKFREAIETLNKATELKKPYGQAHFVLAGIYYQELKDDKNALVHYDAAAADPKYSKAATAAKYAASIREYLDKKQKQKEEQEAIGSDQ